MTSTNFEQDENQLPNVSNHSKQEIENKFKIEESQILSTLSKNLEVPLTEVKNNENTLYFDIFNQKNYKIYTKLSSSNIDCEKSQIMRSNSDKLNIYDTQKSDFFEKNINKSINLYENSKHNIKDTKLIYDNVEIIEEETKENNIENMKENHQQIYNILDLYKVNFKKNQEISVSNPPISKTSLRQLNHEGPFFNQNDSIVSNTSKKDAEQYLYGSKINI